MLFTESELNVFNPLDILNEAEYLTEDESATEIITVPVVQNDYYNCNMIDFKDLERISEEYGCDYIDAMAAIIESEELNPEYTSVVIDEADFILESIDGTVFHEDTIIRPLSEYDPEYQYVAECVEAFLESEDDDYLNLLLLEDLSIAQVHRMKNAGMDIRKILKMERNKHKYSDEIVNQMIASSSVKGQQARIKARQERRDARKAANSWGASADSDGMSNWGAWANQEEIKNNVNNMRHLGSIGTGASGQNAARASDEQDQEEVRKALTTQQDMGLDANPTDWTQMKAPESAPKVSLTRTGKKTKHDKPTLWQRAKNAPGHFAGAMKGYGNILSGKTQIQGANGKNLTKWQMLKQHAAANKGSTAVAGLGAAAAVGAGIYAYKQYKNKPKSVIAKRIAALRGIYRKFMTNAQNNPQKAGVFKRIAAKILSVIDKLMGFLQNKADGR